MAFPDAPYSGVVVSPQSSSTTKLDIGVVESLNMTLKSLLGRRETLYDEKKDHEYRIREIDEDLRVLDIAINGISNAIEPVEEKSNISY